MVAAWGKRHDEGLPGKTSDAWVTITRTRSTGKTRTGNGTTGDGDGCSSVMTTPLIAGLSLVLYLRQQAASNKYPPLNLSPFELINPLPALQAIVPAAIQAMASHMYGNGVYRTDPRRV